MIGVITYLHYMKYKIKSLSNCISAILNGHKVKPTTVSKDVLSSIFWRCINVLNELSYVVIHAVYGLNYWLFFSLN